MRAKIWTDDGQVVVLEDARLALVETDMGNPVLVASEYGFPEAICVSHCKEAEFNSILRNLGINKVVVATDIMEALKPPEQLPVILPDLPLRRRFF